MIKSLICIKTLLLETVKYLFIVKEKKAAIYVIFFKGQYSSIIKMTLKLTTLKGYEKYSNKPRTRCDIR